MGQVIETKYYNICDRCGLREERQQIGYEIGGRIPVHGLEYWLCKDCRVSFQEWLKQTNA